MNILISPHPDDELIGAFSLIKRGLVDTVLYIDPSPSRFALAQKTGEALSFTVGLLEFRQLCAYLEKNPSHTYLVPDILDNHLLHKAVNCVGRLSGCKLGYYSTDMNTGYVKELSAEVKKEKLLALNKFYPDQLSLWKYDWKYFLFEGVVYDAPTAPTTLQK